MHETKDLNVRGVIKFGVALTFTAVAIHLGVAALFGAFRRIEDRADPPRHPLAASPALPPGPRLETSSRAAIDALRREEETLLGTYAWVDRPRGRARIPITRALDLIAKKGLPARVPTPPAD